MVLLGPLLLFSSASPLAGDNSLTDAEAHLLRTCYAPATTQTATVATTLATALATYQYTYHYTDHYTYH